MFLSFFQSLIISSIQECMVSVVKERVHFVLMELYGGKVLKNVKIKYFEIHTITYFGCLLSEN